MHYYQHHIGDFIKDTARLTDSQSMAYLRLIWKYYDDESPLVNDTESLALLLGTDEKVVGQILKMFFSLEEDGWHQSRCDAEIASYRAMLEAKSRAGKASSAKRSSNSCSTPVEQDGHVCATNHEPITNNHISTTNVVDKRKRTTLSKPDSVSQTVWDDFTSLRKAKKAPLTATALAGIEREATKAYLSLEDALSVCCSRGWQSFKADWMNGAVVSGGTKAKTATEKFWEAVNGTNNNQGEGHGRVIDVTPRLG